MSRAFGYVRFTGRCSRHRMAPAAAQNQHLSSNRTAVKYPATWYLLLPDLAKKGDRSDDCAEISCRNRHLNQPGRAVTVTLSGGYFLFTAGNKRAGSRRALRHNHRIAAVVTFQVRSAPATFTLLTTMTGIGSILAALRTYRSIRYGVKQRYSSRAYVKSAITL